MRWCENLAATQEVKMQALILNPAPTMFMKSSMNITSTQLQQLLRLVSQALPVGAYAYSQGLESAVVEGYVKCEEDTLQWIGDLVQMGIGQLDLPVLARQHQCWQDKNLEQVINWNESLAAYRETHELLLEDQQMGRALLRLLLAEDICQAAQWPKTEIPCFATMFALAGSSYDIDVELLLQGFTWSWMENQVGIATKIIPLGQTAAQRILRQLIPLAETVCELASRLEDDEIGFSMPGLAILSSNHEQQSSRLFRS